MTKNACEFLKQVSTISKEKDDNTVNIQKLNNKQRTVFNRIETHYNNILVDKRSEVLRIIIMGTAGTGKSYLIRAIRKKLNMIAECTSGKFYERKTVAICKNRRSPLFFIKF